MALKPWRVVCFCGESHSIMSSNSLPDLFKMRPSERSAAAWIASIYALRMFGMFMILPVFALHAAGLPGGDNLSLVGFAMGVYGLSQACMQIPLGWASDKLGRKPVIVLGLLVFALGCLLGFGLGACATRRWCHFCGLVGFSGRCHTR